MGKALDPRGVMTIAVEDPGYRVFVMHTLVAAEAAYSP